MKKMTSKIFLLFALMTTVATLRAQNTIHTPSDTVAVKKLSANLGISSQKAQQLYSVLHYMPIKELGAIMNNRNMPMSEKSVMIQKLMTARHQKIDSLLTPAQKALLMKQVGLAPGKEMAATTTERLIKQPIPNMDTAKKKRN